MSKFTEKSKLFSAEKQAYEQKFAVCCGDRGLDQMQPLATSIQQLEEQLLAETNAKSRLALQRDLDFLKEYQKFLQNLERAEEEKLEDVEFFIGSDGVKSVHYTFPGGAQSQDMGPSAASHGVLGARVGGATTKWQVAMPLNSIMKVEFESGKCIYVHPNRSMTYKIPSKDEAPEHSNVLVDQVLVEYERKLLADPKASISVKFDKVPPEIREEWRKYVLTSLVYKYASDTSDKKLMDDRFDKICKALIAGGSVTRDDLKRYGIEKSKMYPWFGRAGDELKSALHEAARTHDLHRELHRAHATEGLVAGHAGVDPEKGTVLRKAKAGLAWLAKPLVNPIAKALTASGLLRVPHIRTSTGISETDTSAAMLHHYQQMYPKFSAVSSQGLVEFAQHYADDKDYRALKRMGMRPEQIHQAMQVMKEVSDNKRAFAALKQDAVGKGAEFPKTADAFVAEYQNDPHYKTLTRCYSADRIFKDVSAAVQEEAPAPRSSGPGRAP